MADPAARLIGIAMVKNEQDVIEPFIRHNMRLLDALLIIDHASQDETRRIVRDVMREIPGVILADHSSFAFTQGQAMSAALRHMQAAWFADYVFFLDADEFISAPDRAALMAQLARIPPRGVGLMPWRTWLFVPHDMPGADDDVPGALRWRRARERPAHHKAVLHADGRPCLGHVVLQGNHQVDLANGATLPRVVLEELPLIHVPVRGRDQITGKAVLGWTATLAWFEKSRQFNINHQWRDHFDRICRGEEITDRLLCETAMGYAQNLPGIDWAADVVREDAPIHYERRHSSGRFSAPLPLIARAWEAAVRVREPALELTRPEADAALLADPRLGQVNALWSGLMFVDLPPLRWLVDMVAPASAVDFGCGIGAVARALRQLGVGQVRGVGGLPPAAVALEAGDYVAQPIGSALRLDGGCDLAVSLEQAQDLPPAEAGGLLENLTRHAGKAILFSAAGPDQPGPAGLNRRPIGAWLRDFAALGFGPDLHLTLGVRALASFSWLRRNMVVLRPGVADGRAMAALEAIGERKFSWNTNHLPGIRAEIGQEPYLPGTGYDSAG